MDIDLSGAMVVEYEMDPAPCGTYFLNGFFDDDQNIIASGMPDSGDAVSSTSPVVMIPGDFSTIFQDLPLDFRLP
jgi:hypothetical protein